MIKLTNVKQTYDNGTKALFGVSLQIDDGEFCFLVGPSGSGKSTVIKLLFGELKPTQGTVFVNGYNMNTIPMRQIPYLRRTLGVVFQDFRLIEKKNVFNNIAFAMHAACKPQKEIKKKVNYVLQLVGLQDKAQSFPAQLSGGEQQRVAIARALINNPSIIIADEPTGNLDPTRSLEIMSLLEKINSLGTTLLVVTHEKGLVQRFNKRVITIDDGKIVSDKRGG